MNECLSMHEQFEAIGGDRHGGGLSLRRSISNAVCTGTTKLY